MRWPADWSVDSLARPRPIQKKAGVSSSLECPERFPVGFLWAFKNRKRETPLLHCVSIELRNEFPFCYGIISIEIIPLCISSNMVKNPGFPLRQILGFHWRHVFSGAGREFSPFKRQSRLEYTSHFWKLVWVSKMAPALLFSIGYCFLLIDESIISRKISTTETPGKAGIKFAL